MCICHLTYIGIIIEGFFCVQQNSGNGNNHGKDYTAAPGNQSIVNDGNNRSRRLVRARPLTIKKGKGASQKAKKKPGN